jgi:hypothetical protein
MRLAFDAPYFAAWGASADALIGNSHTQAPPEKFLAAMAPGAARMPTPARTWPYSPPARPPATVPHLTIGMVCPHGDCRRQTPDMSAVRFGEETERWSGQWRVEGSTICSRAGMAIMDDDEFGRTRRRRRRLESPWFDSLGHNGEDELWC